MSSHQVTERSAALGRPAAVRLPMLMLVLGVVGLAIAGMVISAGIVKRGTATPKASLEGPFGVSQDIPTSFGAVAVDNVTKLNGISPKDLAGMTHFPSYVKPNQVQVEAAVTITNLLGKTVDYSPTEFRLLVGDKKKPVSELRATFKPGTLQPDANISGQLKFVAPRNGEKLWIQYTDPKRTQPILIDLGKTGTTPDNAFDGFHKH